MSAGVALSGDRVCRIATPSTRRVVDRSVDDEEILHIISARKAEAYEQATYSDQFYKGHQNQRRDSKTL